MQLYKGPFYRCDWEQRVELTLCWNKEITHLADILYFLVSLFVKLNWCCFVWVIIVVLTLNTGYFFCMWKFITQQNVGQPGVKMSVTWKTNSGYPRRQTFGNLREKCWVPRGHKCCIGKILGGIPREQRHCTLYINCQVPRGKEWVKWGQYSQLKFVTLRTLSCSLF